MTRKIKRRKKICQNLYKILIISRLCDLLLTFCELRLYLFFFLYICHATGGEVCVIMNDL